MATGVTALSALRTVQASRPFVNPNPGFMGQLKEMETVLAAVAQL